MVIPPEIRLRDDRYQPASSSPVTKQSRPLRELLDFNPAMGFKVLTSHSIRIGFKSGSDTCPVLVIAETDNVNDPCDWSLHCLADCVNPSRAMFDLARSVDEVE